MSLTSASMKPRAFQWLLRLGALALLPAPALAHVEIDAPNGGEVFLPGSVVTIEWHVTITHALNDWDVWYSTTGNDGPWNIVAMNLPAGSNQAGSVHTFEWTVPSTPSTDVYVRVRMDNNATNYFDVSDAALAIVSFAEASVRNGSDINKACFNSLSSPVLGSEWTSEVLHPGNPSTSLTVVLGRAGLATGPIIGGGEILIDVSSPKLFSSSIPSSGTADIHRIPIPNDVSLSGMRAYAQAAVIDGSSLRLCNAIDLILGD